MIVRITHAGQTVDATDSTWQAQADSLVKAHGPWNSAAGSKVERIEELTPTLDPEAQVVADAAAKGLSDWGATIVDPEAKARIDRIDAAMQAGGLGAIQQGRQAYDRGTRMAESGYRHQAQRKVAFDGLTSVKDEIARGVATIQAEKRRDVKLTAGEVGRQLSMNGSVRWNGLKMREQAIRGLLGRLESPALRYVLGLRDRIMDPDATDAGKAQDREAMLDALQRECKRFPDEPVMFRVREGLGDVFTTVSQDYTSADFDTQAPLIARELPPEAKAFFRYDPTTTRWELQAQVWTPTPTAEQAVGEPFRGYTSLKGGDAGLTSIWGGGGLEILACLNASTFAQDFAGSGRRSHRGDVMRDLRRILRDSIKSLDILVNAWGRARATVIEPATDAQGRLIPIEVAIPGFYRSMLTQRQGVLVGRLPGRTEGHVQGLKAAYLDERRNPADITRADLAQGYTRYIQQQPTSVRLDAESAVGRWLVNAKGEPLSYLAS